MFNIITPKQEKYLKTLPKPIVQLVGFHVNAFDIIFHFEDAAKTVEWVKEDIDLVIREMMSNKYHHLLIVCQEFTKESEHDDGQRIVDLGVNYDFIKRGGCSGDDSAD